MQKGLEESDLTKLKVFDILGGALEIEYNENPVFTEDFVTEEK